MKIYQLSSLAKFIYHRLSFKKQILLPRVKHNDLTEHKIDLMSHYSSFELKPPYFKEIVLSKTCENINSLKET